MYRKRGTDKCIDRGTDKCIDRGTDKCIEREGQINV